MSTFGRKHPSNLITPVSSSDDEEEEKLTDDEFHSDFGNDEDDDDWINYPEQPSLGKPTPAPPPEEPSSTWTRHALSQLSEIALIYIKFAILAIIIYSAALWYTVHYGDMDSDDKTTDSETCPAR